jgi:hypothetical protein
MQLFLVHQVSSGAAVVVEFLLFVKFNFRMISVKKSITISVLPTVIFISSAPRRP